MAEYKWAAGSRMTKKIADPQMVGNTLDTLQQENGGKLTPRVVVEAARPIDAPLHPCFEWNDLRAAEFYREDQARHVISSVRIVQRSDNPKDEPQLIHAYVSLLEDGEDGKARGYVPIMRVFHDDALLKQTMQRAAAELRAFETRYREFEAIASAARTAREQIENAA